MTKSLKKLKKIDWLPIIGGIATAILILYPPATQWVVRLVEQNPIAFYVVLVPVLVSTFVVWAIGRLKKLTK